MKDKNLPDDNNLKSLEDLVKEAKGTFGYYDIFTKIQGDNSSQIEDVITKKIRNIPNVTATTTLSIIPEQDFEKWVKKHALLTKKDFQTN